MLHNRPRIACNKGAPSLCSESRCSVYIQCKSCTTFCNPKLNAPWRHLHGSQFTIHSLEISRSDLDTELTRTSFQADRGSATSALTTSDSESGRRRVAEELATPSILERHWRASSAEEGKLVVHVINIRRDVTCLRYYFSEFKLTSHFSVYNNVRERLSITILLDFFS